MVVSDVGTLNKSRTLRDRGTTRAIVNKLTIKQLQNWRFGFLLRVRTLIAKVKWRRSREIEKNVNARVVQSRERNHVSYVSVRLSAGTSSLFCWNDVRSCPRLSYYIHVLSKSIYLSSPRKMQFMKKLSHSVWNGPSLFRHRSCTVCTLVFQPTNRIHELKKTRVFHFLYLFR